MWSYVSLFLVVTASTIDCLEKLISEMTCYLLSRTLNHTQSLTHAFCWCYLEQANTVISVTNRYTPTEVVKRAITVYTLHWCMPYMLPVTNCQITSNWMISLIVNRNTGAGTACRWLSHKPNSRLALLSTRPMVTFPATEHHCCLVSTKLYCLEKEGTCVWIHVQSHYTKVQQ